MLEEILDMMKENFGNWSLKPLGTRVDVRRETLEKSMYDFLKLVQDRVVSGGKWRALAETLAAEDEVRSLFDDVVLDHATFEEFKTACHRWEALGTSQETVVPAEKAGTQIHSTIGGTSAEGVNPLMEDARKRAAVHKPGVGRPGTISAPTKF